LETSKQSNCHSIDYNYNHSAAPAIKFFYVELKIFYRTGEKCILSKF